MKLMILMVLLPLCASAQKQGAEEQLYQQGQSLPVPAQDEKASASAAKKRDADAAGTNVIRVVAGKAYNVVNSTNWVTLPNNNCTDMEVLNVRADGLVVGLQCFDRRVGGQVTLFTVLVKNHPQQKTALTGTRLKHFRAMQTGRQEYSGETVAVYDFGSIPRK